MKRSENILKVIAIFLISVVISSVFSIHLLSPVSASNELQEYEYSEDFVGYQGTSENTGLNVCCQRTKQESEYKGESCVYTSSNNCDLTAGQPSGTTCEQTEDCKPGVCIVDGVCNSNTLKGVCLDQGGQFNVGTKETIQVCQKGCCALPTGSAFITQAKCASAIKDYGSLRLSTVFDASVPTENACLSESRSLNTGCCVLPNECSFATAAECSSKNGEFKPNGLCSFSEYGCQVTEKHHTGCFKEKVYWFDSDNNPENIYGTNYRTDGKRVSPSDSCNANSNNVESLTCGNCDFSKGSICTGIPDGVPVSDDKLKFWCGDLSCKDLETSDTNLFWEDDLSGRDFRANGEEWCEYEGVTGKGNDLVGSEHYKRSCFNGKVKVETCQENRNEICAQGVIPKSVSGLSFDYSSAKCQPNNADECLSLNVQDDGTCSLSGEELEEARTAIGECSDLKDDERFECGKKQLCRKNACGEAAFGKCFWNDAIKVCSPAVPEGDLSGNSCERNFGENGVWTCKEYWYNGPFSISYEKQSNSDCTNPEYIEGLQNFCRSLGDCGFNYNVLGDKGNGFTAFGPDDRLDGEPSVIETNGNIISIRGVNLPIYPFNNKVEEPLNGSLYFQLYNLDLAFASFVDSDKPDSGRTAANILLGTAGGAIAFSAIFLGGSLSFGTLGAVLSFGTVDIFATGGTAAAVKGTSVATLSTPASIAAIATVAVIGVAALILILNYFGTDDATITYEYTCNAWVPPDGGKNCERCNDFNECTKYKCESLGRACELKNEFFVGNETCIWVDENDIIFPTIKLLPVDPKTENDFIFPSRLGAFEGYEFKEKLDPFANIKIGVETNEFATCVIDNSPSLEYDQMKVFEDTRLKKEHIMTINAANIPASPPGSEGTEIQIDDNQILAYAGRENIYYVKCKDDNGNKKEAPFFIKFEVDTGPDPQPPVIEGFSINDNSFIPKGLNKTDILVFTNEPVLAQGGCRFSASDKNYDLMGFNTTCLQGRTGNNQFACSAKLEDLEDNKDNTFFFRCKDLAGNINSESTSLNLRGTKGLKIDSAKPNGLVYAEDVILELETSEGAENGKASCEYSFTKFLDPNRFKFEVTDDVKHTQSLPLQSGSYDIYTWCRDLAGNFDEKLLEVEVNTGLIPTVNAIYTSSGGILNIRTDEKATCRFSNDNKEFSFDDGVELTSNDMITHGQVIDDNEVFHVLCKHEFTGQTSNVLSVYPKL